MIIGLTIVGFGTSAPELLVSSIAAASGSEGLSIGNAIGSNITNATIVLGAAVLVAPMVVHRQVIRRELPVLFLVMVGSGVLFIDGELSQAEGSALLAGLAILLGVIVWSGVRQHRAGVPAEEIAGEDLPPEMGSGIAIFWLLVGLGALLGSARAVIWGADTIAGHMGVGDLVVGLTVIALGTSLPELAATVVSAWKNQHDLAIGNVVGSNMFNTLGVLGLPGVIAPGPVEAEVLTRDYPVMLGAVAVVFLFAWRFGQGEPRLGRLAGLVLSSVYIVYITALVIQSLHQT